MQTQSNIFAVDFMPSNQIEDLEFSAQSQEERILIFFEANDFFGYETFGASQIWKAVRKGEFEPITSIRRALSSLQMQGKVIRLKETRIGLFGKSESLWKLQK